jgi:hypothetical protein
VNEKCRFGQQATDAGDDRGVWSRQVMQPLSFLRKIAAGSRFRMNDFQEFSLRPLTPQSQLRWPGYGHFSYPVVASRQGVHKFFQKFF